MENRPSGGKDIWSRQTVLIVDASARARQRGAAVVESLGARSRVANDAFEAHGLIDGCSAVIAVHSEAPEIYPRLHAANIALLLCFTGRIPRPAEVTEAMGADGYVTRPLQKAALGLALYAAARARLLRERALRAELALAELTSAGGQDADRMLHLDLFKTLLPLEIRRARRHGYPIAICVVALDAPAGGAVAPGLAAACEPLVRRAVRDVDLAMRYGDGRFLVSLPHTDARGAEAVGRRIANEIRRQRLRTGDGATRVTVSVGIAAPRAGSAPSFARLVRDAHVAVRAARLKGGDRVILR